jgi:hypothetical protein
MLALLGALLAVRSRNPDATPYALVILSYPAVFYITHGSGRYRHPIDPVLTLLAVFAVAYPFRLLLGSTATQPKSNESAPVPMESVTP